MNFAIVGCGLIGEKRLRSLPKEHRVLAVVDTDSARAAALASRRDGTIALTDWREALRLPGLDALVVATTNEALARITQAAVAAGKHVLVEKPAGVRVEELDPILKAVDRSRTTVRVGFNHRFHPALRNARRIVDAGELGDLMFLRARYGHGGRIGYDREWRADPALSGGGELLDQGIHLIDLSRWFLGDFLRVEGFVHTFFWNMTVEDNGFLLLRTAANRVAWLHASCTEWKNCFSFELYGRDGKLQVDGLGGSYGVERLSHYRMLPAMGPPETTIWEYPGEDESWRLEMEAFVGAVEGRQTGGATLSDARAALEIVQRVYQDSGPEGRA